MSDIQCPGNYQDIWCDCGECDEQDPDYVPGDCLCDDCYSEEGDIDTEISLTEIVDLELDELANHDDFINDEEIGDNYSTHSSDMED